MTLIEKNDTHKKNCKISHLFFNRKNDELHILENFLLITKNLFFEIIFLFIDLLKVQLIVKN